MKIEKKQLKDRMKLKVSNKEKLNDAEFNAWVELVKEELPTCVMTGVTTENSVLKLNECLR